MYQTNMYEGMLAETITLHGFHGDVINAYYARPLGPGPFPGMVVIHHAPGWDESQIRIGAGGWLVPLGNGHFKAGSTYEWNELDGTPTAKGRTRIEEIARRLGGGGDFEVTAHEAAVRPILRRSEPLIGPAGGGDWMFNALGSKGCLYAPGMARRLARWLTESIEPEPEVDIRNFHSTESG